jgi:iron complex outermembrane receptor protein
MNENRYPALRNALRIAGGAALTSLLATAPPALAQEESTQARRGGVIEEVVVTARRRTESLQDVPMAVTAFSDERLFKQFAVDLRDFGTAVPNFQLEQVGLFQSAAAFSARGVGTGGIESFADPVVAVFVDGQYYPRNANALLDIFDLEAVEVMRGPQGTLYGQNAFAGAISVRTRRPTGEAGIRGEATYGSYGTRIAKFAAESPIIDDTLNAKISLIHRDFDGYFKVRNLSQFTDEQIRTFSGPDATGRLGDSAQGETKTVGRLSVQYLPREDTELNLIVTREWNRGDGSPGINGFFAPGGNPSVFELLGFRGRDPFGDSHRGISGDGSDPFKIGANHRDINNQNLINAVAELVWDSPIGEWTTMLAYQRVDSYITTDTDGELVNLFSSERQEDYKSFQFETRVSTELSDRSRLLTGLFFLRDEYELYQLLLLGFGNAGNPAAIPPRFPVPAFQFPNDIRSTSLGNNGQERISAAPYVDFYYDLNDDLTLNLALRGTYEQKQAFNIPNQNPIGPAYATPDKGNFRRAEFALDCGSNTDSWFNLAPRVGLDYRPSPGILVFGFWQRAYKSGGLLNNSATCQPFQERPFDEERVDNFEVGVKSNLFDNRLLLNVNAFFSRYTDLQRTVIRFAPSTPTQQETFTSNAAGAESWGFELESQAVLTQNLSLIANIGYLNAEYDGFCADLNGPQFYAGVPTSACGSVEQIADGRYLVDEDNSNLDLVRAPDWDLSTRLVYDWPLGNMGNLSIEGAYSYTSKLHTAVGNALRTDRGSLSRVDASITWSDPQERYRVAVWGKNLGDNVERLSRTEVATLFTFEFPTEPRTWGITVSADL